jgi:hypothetical protein
MGKIGNETLEFVIKKKKQKSLKPVVVVCLLFVFLYVFPPTIKLM